MINNGQDWVAMILAGGKGSRLNELTSETAKPAVLFGGKYRIIDFTLSNCRNSGVNTVGVLIQYKPFELNTHIGEGRSWDLHGTWSGVYILPPYTEKNGVCWYKGTADSVYQNLEFLSTYNPKYVLILSGDHIYKMDYQKMLQFHIASQASVTISVMEVPYSEAHRFGIMNTDNKGKIFEFEEKPQQPKNNLASMGIYIFNYDKLKEYLEKDSQNPTSTRDFGKDIIPQMLANEERLCSYIYQGYWRDVGTVKSFYDANMDLLSSKPFLKLDCQEWPILSRSSSYPPQYISETAKVRNSIISEGCHLEGTVENSVLSPGVTIKKNAVVENSVLLENTIVEQNATIKHAITCQNCHIKSFASINQENHQEPVLVPQNTTITQETKLEEVLT
ncbi:glucose-1-phosphate adenylyltransferase [Natranaerobius thermophilus]|uniref:Glucose-1-phosphate adenylyltransferase n=1 Tax=Natranaerobius thermophilus (strain ATCC BAA-1301 / DSM 18059 / JW/NM-WN-LF) TaxID=457570 RepID=B2A6E9_NATTJ|nr:glucose-1-phosphate adenylyltransferase [Natranaerobius thermophilus]ACB84157.1 glucose-1-phosphate adenylyltransferase [Natranaerobius thermophilus JW/NM-WN-LF]